MTRSSRAEQRLILLSAGTSSRRAAMGSRAERLIADVDWETLAGTLHLRRLLPTLGPRIVELAKGRAGDEFRVAVEHAVETGRRHGAFCSSCRCVRSPCL